jgi:DNA recombination protein RmuC
MILLLSSLILLVALIAAVGAWRRSGPSAEDLRRLLDEHQARGRQDQGLALQPLQAELARMNGALSSQKAEADAALLTRFQEVQNQLGAGLQSGRSEQAQQLELLRKTLDAALTQSRQELGQRMDAVQLQVQQRLQAIQEGNEQKLEQMRVTVDEKLHATLEKRLGESFSLVAQRLEEVQKGLGEMQSLAQDVGGLKRALTNVKNRGVLGEAQLGALLEQYLSSGQYIANAQVKRNSAERVEFAVKLPGPGEEPVLLPIDAKFPIEDYQRLMDAYESGDVEGIARSAQALEMRILSQAREIRDKYVNPPTTTNFGLLFLPFEGLYAEALRRPGLLDKLQELKVSLVGPTTLTAFLNSLQMGFKTLAISKQSAEVWKTLAAIKTDFAKFGEALEAVQKKLDEAGSKLGDVSKRSSILQKKLGKVDALPEAEAQALLGGEEP